MCTNVIFDFDVMKWTDHEFIEDSVFVDEWNKTFGGFWDNLDELYPKQPYQPLLIALGYKKSMRYSSQFSYEPYVVQFQSITGLINAKISNLVKDRLEINISADR